MISLLILSLDGPVLSQTDLYLLDVPLEIHPILKGTDSFHLSFDLTNGQLENHPHQSLGS